MLGSNDVARKRLLSTAANKGGDLLINGGEFAWLREELGLQDTNIGVFNGEWAASCEQVSLQLLAQSIIVNCIMI